MIFFFFEIDGVVSLALRTGDAKPNETNMKMEHEQVFDVWRHSIKD